MFVYKTELYDFCMKKQQQNYVTFV